MEAKWYYADGGQKVGPLTQEQLAELAASGVITPDHLIWRTGTTEWVKAGTVEGLCPRDRVQAAELPPPLPTTPQLPQINAGEQPTPSSFPPVATPNQIGVQSKRSGTAVLVLTIVGGFFSIFVGGCTGAAANGLAKAGENISNFESSYGRHSDSNKIKNDAESIKKSGAKAVGLGFLSGVLGIAAGIFASKNYNNNSILLISGKPYRRLTLAGIAIIFAAVLTVFNIFSFITAGVMFAVAGTLTILQAKNSVEYP